MSYQPYPAALSYANPQLYINPTLYTLGDTETYPARNRKIDQTLSFLQFIPIHDGKLELYQRRTRNPQPEGPDADMVNPANAEVDQDNPYEIDPDEPHVFRLQEIAGRFNLRNITQQVLSDDIEQERFQVAAKVRAIRAAFGHYFIHGDSSADAAQFDGLNVWTTSASTLGQSLDHGAGQWPFAEIFDTLDEAIIALQSNDRNLANLAIVCHSRLVKALATRAREINGQALLEIKYSPDLQAPAPHYMGIPIFINDHIDIQSGDVTDYFVLDRTTVVGLVNSNAPEITLASVQSGTASGKSHFVSWNAGLASFTDLGLVRVVNQETKP